MKRPFCMVALLYVGGILLGDLVPGKLPLLFCVGVVLAIGALFWERRQSVLLAAALVLAGWFNMTRHTAAISPCDLRLLVGQQPELLCVRGTLAASPTERIFERNQRESWRSTAMLEVSQLLRGTNWQPATGIISVTTPGVLDDPFYAGQSVEVTGVIHPPGPPVAPGLIDAQTYLRRQGVYYQLNATTNDWQLWKTDPPRKKPLSVRFHAWAKETLARGLPIEDQPLRLTWTLMLDWRAPMTQSVQEPFVRAGTFHIFAVDGLRIGLIAGILLLLFRVLQIPRGISGLLVIPAIWFYAGLTGFPASAIRAAIMMTVIIFGWTLRRPSDLLNSLFAAGFIILLWDPRQVFLPGFQLSFVVVFFIAILITPFKQWRDRLFQGDPFLPAKLRWHPAPWLSSVGWFTYETLSMSVAAWAASLPLAACYFHIFNWVSIPANCLVVPLTILAVSSSLGSLAVGVFWPLGAELFNNASWLLMNCITEISQWFARLPGACFNVATPSPATFVGFYLALALIGSAWIFKSAYKRQAWMALGLLGVIWAGSEVLSSLETRLHVLPLEGGHAVYVATAFRPDFLIDCGNGRPAESVTKPFLSAQGVNRLSTLCLSDAAQRLMGGAEFLNTNFTIKRVALSAARARSPGYRQFAAALDKAPERRQFVLDGGSILDWSVLNPTNAARLLPADDNALVLRKYIYGKSVLLLSDLSRAGEKALLDRHPELQADILIAGLPARDEPLSDWLLEAIKPQLIVVADSPSPAPRRASKAVRDRLARQPVPVLFCSETGALTFVFGPFGWHVETTDGRRVSLNKPVAPAMTQPEEAPQGSEPTESE